MNNSMRDKIRKLSVSATAPNGKEYLRISSSSIKDFAKHHNLKVREVEILALEIGTTPDRYQRNVGTMGLEGQARLLRSKIVILGLGGLGGMVVELLARLGVGHLVVVDCDVFEETNMNRQILSQENNLGLSKTDAAIKRVESVNQGIEVIAHFTILKEDNIEEIVDGADVVVDALDNIPTRLQVERATKKKGIPLVHGAIAGFIGQVLTIFPQDKGLEGIYGVSGKITRGIETELGTPGVTPAMVAAWQVQEVIKIVLKKGRPLRNRLLSIDALEGYMEIVNLYGKE